MTIRTGIYRSFIFFLVVFTTGELAGQVKDFQTWFEVEIDKGLKNGIDLSAEVEQRFKNNSLEYDRTLVTLAGDYNITGYLNAAAGMRALLSKDRDANLHGRFRLHADATGECALSVFDLSLRARLQYGFEDISIFGQFQDNNLVNRNKFRVRHHIFGTRVGFFASAESWYILSGRPERNFYRMRYSAGADYKLNFRSEFSLRYILDDEFNVANPMQAHILVFGFAHSL